MKSDTYGPGTLRKPEVNLAALKEAAEGYKARAHGANSLMLVNVDTVLGMIEALESRAE